MRLSEVVEPKMLPAYKRLVMNLSHVLNSIGWNLRPSEHPDTDLADQMNELNDLAHIFVSDGKFGRKGRGTLMVGQHRADAGLEHVYVAISFPNSQEGFYKAINNVVEDADPLYRRKLDMDEDDPYTQGGTGRRLVGFELMLDH